MITRNPESGTDGRHHRLMVELDRMYRAHNDGLPLPNPGRVAKRLANFLKANPSWPLERLRRAVWCRFATLEANPAEDPALWINKLPNYAAGPLGKFGRVLAEEAAGIAEHWEQHPELPLRSDHRSWDDL